MDEKAKSDLIKYLNVLKSKNNNNGYSYVIDELLMMIKLDNTTDQMSEFLTNVNNCATTIQDYLDWYILPTTSFMVAIMDATKKQNVNSD